MAHLIFLTTMIVVVVIIICQLSILQKKRDYMSAAVKVSVSLHDNLWS